MPRQGASAQPSWSPGSAAPFCLVAASSSRSCAIAPMRSASACPSESSTSFRRGGQADDARLRRACGRRLLDSRHPAYGGDRRTTHTARRYELLYPLLDLTTTLDPYFTDRVSLRRDLSERSPTRGPGRPDQAERLLRKGIAVQPGKWQYYYDIGFVYYWHVRDYKAAATWFQRAPEQPNAPNWLPPLAAMLTTGNDRAAARFLWQQMLQSDQEWLRRNAERVSCSSTPWTASTGSKRSSNGIRQPGEQVTWEGLMRRSPLREVPTDFRHPVRARSGDRSGDGRHRLAVAAHARSGTASIMNVDRLRSAAGLSRLGGWRSAAFSTLYPSIPRQRVHRPAGIELPALRLHPAGVRQHPGLQLRALGGRCRRAKPDLDALPDRRVVTTAIFVLHYLTFGLDIILGRPAVCRRDDRALRDRPQAPSAARCHHPARDRLGLASASSSHQAFSDALIGVIAGGGVLWLVGEAYTGIRVRKAWAGAT